MDDCLYLCGSLSWKIEQWTMAKDELHEDILFTAIESSDAAYLVNNQSET